MNEKRLRVLVVDDTVVYRRIVSEILASLPGVEVVSVAANGRIALQKVEQLRPDLLTLDLEMPEMDGLEVLRQLKAINEPAGAIMLSAFTTKGADATVAALKLGAFDFVLKPSGTDADANLEDLRRELGHKIEAFARARSNRDTAGESAASRVVPAKKPTSTSDVIRRMSVVAQAAPGKPEVVAVGISTGGPQALSRMLPQLPGDLAAPVLIVQHMPPKFTASLAHDLNSRCQLAVSEAAEGDAVVAGRILIAPGGRQMKLDREEGRMLVRVTDDPPENHCRPAVDYLFRSVAQVCGPNAVGVIMTGMGSDGALGCRLMKRRGAAIVTQDEATCVVYGMPKQPTEEGLADTVAPLENIATEITRLAGRGVPAWK